MDQLSGGPARAVIILPPSRERDDLIAALRVTGYDVRLSDRREDPMTVANEERPDLVVIGTAAGEGDPSAIASAWTSRREIRPRAVVLIETLRAVDRLRAVVAGVDAVVPIERMLDELPRYARTLARAGAPPSSVLLAEHDADAPRRSRGGWRTATSVWCAVRWPRRFRNSSTEKFPMCSFSQPPFRTPPVKPCTRMVRQDPRFHLLPILLLGPGDRCRPDRRPSCRCGRLPPLSVPIRAS